VPRKKTTNKPANLRIKQIKSGNRKPGQHRRTLAALGLKHHQDTVVQRDTPAIRGMVFQVQHLVEVHELAEGEE
jgi:large subunit ribosomal protein L30